MLGHCCLPFLGRLLKPYHRPLHVVSSSFYSNLKMSHRILCFCLAVFGIWEHELLKLMDFYVNVTFLVCLLQLVSHGYWEKDPNMKQVLLWWFKTGRQHTEPELSWYGWIPVTIWTRTLSLPLAALVLLKSTKASLSEWYWLENSSSGFLMLPCFISGMCQSQCSGFSLIIHSKCFPPSFLISFGDEGLLVSCIVTFVLTFFSGLFNFKGFQASESLEDFQV